MSYVPLVHCIDIKGLSRPGLENISDFYNLMKNAASISEN